jgi:hypothetical protein
MTNNANSQHAQQAAMNHQMHTHSITVLTELYKNTPIESNLRPALEEALLGLLEPFLPRLAAPPTFQSTLEPTFQSKSIQSEGIQSEGVVLDTYNPDYTYTESKIIQ